MPNTSANHKKGLLPKVGMEKDSEIDFQYGLWSPKKRGEKCVYWCTANEQHLIWLTPKTVVHPGKPERRLKIQIIYLEIDKRGRNAIVHCKTCPSADCESDNCQSDAK